MRNELAVLDNLACTVNDDAATVASQQCDVDQLYLYTSVISTFDAEGKHASAAERKVLALERAVGAGGQTRVRHPFDLHKTDWTWIVQFGRRIENDASCPTKSTATHLVVALQPFGNTQCVVGVLPHPEAQGFNA